MTAIDRRRFCKLLGAGLAGVSTVLVAGCSNGSSDAAPDKATDRLSGVSLTGVAFSVRRDPG